MMKIGEGVGRIEQDGVDGVAELEIRQQERRGLMGDGKFG